MLAHLALQRPAHAHHLVPPAHPAAGDTQSCFLTDVAGGGLQVDQELAQDGTNQLEFGRGRGQSSLLPGVAKLATLVFFAPCFVDDLLASR